jgi:hypothetical protein
MTILKCFIALILFLTFQSCKLFHNTEIAKYSNYKQLSKTINPTNSFIRFPMNVKVVDQNKILLFIYDKDSIELDKSCSDYYCLFNSGLISFSLLNPYHFGSSKLKIWKVEEISYKFLGRKTRIFKLSGGITGGKITYLDGSNYQIEIRNDRARKHWNLEQFVKDAKVTKYVEFV